jgi:hypothetical protein
MSMPQKSTAWITDFTAWASMYDPEVPPSPVVAIDPPDIASWRRDVLVPFARAAAKLRLLGARADHDEGIPMRKNFNLHVYPSPSELDTWNVSVTFDSQQGIICYVTPRCPVGDFEVFLPTSEICAESGHTDGRCHVQALAKVLKWADECSLGPLKNHRTTDEGD